MSTYTHAWLCQQIVDHAQDAVIFADGDGVIRLWNAGAEAIFGLERTTVPKVSQPFS
jgi:PAS domain S-box-containing protein